MTVMGRPLRGTLDFSYTYGDQSRDPRPRRPDLAAYPLSNTSSKVVLKASILKGAYIAKIRGGEITIFAL